MEAVTRDFELAKVEEAKKQFLDAYKKHNAEAVDKMSKSAAKKHERSTLLNWQHTNSVLGQSLSLESAIMYMQNALT